MSSKKRLSNLTDTVTIESFTEMSKSIYQELFTEDEWDAIYSAMADYQDHGENETELAYSVQSKITELFN